MSSLTSDMSKSNFSINELRELSNKIIENPDTVDELTEEELLEVRKFINPYGPIPSSKKQYVNLSLVNWRDIYLRRLHITALIGYLYKVASEFEPTDEIDDYLKNTTDDDKTKSEKVKLMKSTANGLIMKFLNRHFNFDPNLHVSSAFKNKDSEQYRSENLQNKESIKKRAKQTLSLLKERKENYPNDTKSTLMTCYQTVKDSENSLYNALGALLNPNLSLEDKQSIIYKKYKELNNLTEELKQHVEPLSQYDTIHAKIVDPPSDIYYHFDRYIRNNYEELKNIVEKCYCEKEDFEYAAILYGAFDSAEEAKEFRITHEKDFKTDVLTLETGAPTLIGPFKENIEKIDFYNKNTEIVKQMFDQLDSDHKLGKDIMEKRVKVKQKKKITESGPDDPALDAYIKCVNTVRQLGAKRIKLTKEEEERLKKAKEELQVIKEDYEVPDDAIQVDVFYTKNDELKKTKFYSQAEAPLHLQEDSDYSKKYQPKKQ